MPKFIPLLGGGEAIIDDQDYEYINQFIWYSDRKIQNIDNFIAVRVVHNNGRAFFKAMHHDILSRDSQCDKIVDHINGNSLDNRRINLRLVTTKQNAWNRKPSSSSSHGYKGITRNVGRKKNPWKAVIKINGKSHWIGAFPTKYDAAIAYCERAKQEHGEYAYVQIVRLPVINTHSDLV